MNHQTEQTKILHDIKSKCASLKSAAELYRDCSAEEKREMLALMREAAGHITEYLAQLDKAR